jgi:hypothetical protein
MGNSVKKIASVLTAVYVLTIVLSFACVLISITHTHNGEHCSCAICIYAEDVTDLLQKYHGGDAVNNLAGSVISFLILLCLGFSAPQMVAAFSLLSQKVKLND